MGDGDVVDLEAVDQDGEGDLDDQQGAGGHADAELAVAATRAEEQAGDRGLGDQDDLGQGGPHDLGLLTAEARAGHDVGVGHADDGHGEGQDALEAEEGAAGLDVARHGVGAGRALQAGDQQPAEERQEEGAGEEGDEVEAVEALGVDAGREVDHGEGGAADAGDREGDALDGTEQRGPGLLDAAAPAEEADAGDHQLGEDRVAQHGGAELGVGGDGEVLAARQAGQADDGAEGGGERPEQEAGAGHVGADQGAADDAGAGDTEGHEGADQEGVDAVTEGVADADRGEVGGGREHRDEGQGHQQGAGAGGEAEDDGADEEQDAAAEHGEDVRAEGHGEGQVAGGEARHAQDGQGAGLALAGGVRGGDDRADQDEHQGGEAEEHRAEQLPALAVLDRGVVADAGLLDAGELGDGVDQAALPDLVVLAEDGLGERLGVGLGEAGEALGDGGEAAGAEDPAGQLAAGAVGIAVEEVGPEGLAVGADGVDDEAGVAAGEAVEAVGVAEELTALGLDLAEEVDADDLAVLDLEGGGGDLQGRAALEVLVAGGERAEVDGGEEEVREVLATAQEVALEVDGLGLEDQLGGAEVGEALIDAGAELVEDRHADALLGLELAVDAGLIAVVVVANGLPEAVTDREAVLHADGDAHVLGGRAVHPRQGGGAEPGEAAEQGRGDHGREGARFEVTAQKWPEALKEGPRPVCRARWSSLMIVVHDGPALLNWSTRQPEALECSMERRPRGDDFTAPQVLCSLR